MTNDFNSIVLWWFTIFCIGSISLPITAALFPTFFDKGYTFAKILGIAVVSYLVFFLGILHILSFTQLNIIIILIVLLISTVILSKKKTILTILKTHWKVFLFEEILLFLCLWFWSYVRGASPDIHGLEKYMDYGFVNSILRSQYFPPKDMWFTPYSINYYYFGHLITAVLTKLSGIPSPITFNLMLATLFAFCFVGSFSIGAALWQLFNQPLLRLRTKFGRLLAGFLTAFLATFAGNIHTLYAFFKNYGNDNPVPPWQLAFLPGQFPNAYWYPNATRFIYHTIHEFPIYSFVVSDLHGHVVDIPFVLLTIALLLSLFMTKKILNTKYIILNMFLFGFLLAVMYTTNALDGPIYFLLIGLMLFYFEWQRIGHDRKKNTTNNFILQLLPFAQIPLNNKQISAFKNYLLNHWVIDLLIGLLGYWVILGSIFVIFALPFSLFFKPFASKIGILCAPKFLTDRGGLGPLLFEANHCQHSPWWQLLILYGFFYFWVVSFVVFIITKKNSLSQW